MQDKARAYTDRKLEELEKELGRVYARAKTELEQTWREYMASFEEREKPFIRAILDAEHGGDEKTIKKAYVAHARFLRENTLQNNHYKRLVNDMSYKLANTDKAAYELVNNILPDIYAVNYNSLKIPAGYVFGLINPETVINLVMGELDLLKSVWWNRERLNAAILQGILQGESIPKIAKRLEGWVGGNNAAAVRAARTAVTYAENQGRLDSMKAAADECGLIYEKQWIATHDNRTRDSHRKLHGDIAALDERFANNLLCPCDPDGAPEERYNCRCTMNRVLTGIRRRDGTFVPWHGKQISDTEAASTWGKKP